MINNKKAGLLTGFITKIISGDKWNKEKILLSEKQMELLQWLCRHIDPFKPTAYRTWELLFNERNSHLPDKCIAIYDELTIEEKVEVELIFARFVAVALYHRNDSKIINAQKCLESLAYKEFSR